MHNDEVSCSSLGSIMNGGLVYFSEYHGKAYCSYELMGKYMQQFLIDTHSKSKPTLLPDLPSLPSDPPHAPISLDHNPGIKIRHLPLDAPELVFTRGDDPIEFSRNSGRVGQRLHVPLHVRRREPSDEDRTLCSQQFWNDGTPFCRRYDLENGVTVLVDRRRGWEPETGGEEDERVGVRIKRVPEEMVNVHVIRLHSRDRQLVGIRDGVGGHPVDFDFFAGALQPRNRSGGRWFIDVRDVALFFRLRGGSGRC